MQIPATSIAYVVGSSALLFGIVGYKVFVWYQRFGKEAPIVIAGLQDYTGDSRMDHVRDRLRGLCAGLNAGGQWRDRALAEHVESGPADAIRETLARLEETDGGVAVRSVNIVRQEPRSLREEYSAEERAAYMPVEMPERRFVCDIEYGRTEDGAYKLLETARWAWGARASLCPSCGASTRHDHCEFCGAKLTPHTSWAVVEILPGEQ